VLGFVICERWNISAEFGEIEEVIGLVTV
jgi:hypothetical protein